MMELAFLNNWFSLVLPVIRFRRSLIQALSDQSPLLQVPHVTSDMLPGLPSGQDALWQLCDHPDHPGLAKLTPEQKLDAAAFLQHLPRMRIEAKMEDDEDLIPGDAGTISITLTRTNLAEKCSAGVVHAPLFPAPKEEEWWLFLRDKKSNQMFSYKKVSSMARVFVVRPLGEFNPG